MARIMFHAAATASIEDMHYSMENVLKANEGALRLSSWRISAKTSSPTKVATIVFGEQILLRIISFERILWNAVLGQLG